MSRILTIIGKRGYGKTTLAKRLIRESVYSDIYINDYLGEYQSISIPEKRIYIVRENIDLLIRECWDRGNSLLVLDEVDLYGKYCRSIEMIFRYGRHRNIEIISVSRRFYDLPVIIRALSDYFLVFRITERRDLDYLSRYIDKDLLERIRQLPKFTFIPIKI